MERTLKHWFISPEAPVIGQLSARTIFLVSILVLIALAVIFGPSSGIPIEDLWE